MHKTVTTHQRALVIDDNPAVRTALEVLLSLQGMQVLVAASTGEGLAVLQREAVDIVIQDMNFTRDTTSGEEGVELFHHIRREWPDVPIILLTAWTHIETAVDLVKAGAADYVAKPWDDTRLTTTVLNLLQLRNALTESRRLQCTRMDARQALRDKYDLRDVVYDSDAMHVIVATATQIAHANVPVVITGPSGAGKEVIADIIQANSSCRNGPYIKVNVGALPSELMESELFGATQGAYTGARAHAGRFEVANGGTLFLDEIGTLSLAGQAKLLRVLQTGEFEPLGSTVTQRVQVRIISATNSDLRSAIAQGRFREDLYYRLNAIELYIPPLASRRDDILPLAHHFLEAGFVFGAAAERALLSYSWPGNVRELQNCVLRACLLSSGGVIELESLNLPQIPPIRGEAQLNRAVVEEALMRASGVISIAARELGLSRQALYRQMEKFGLKEAPARHE